ncbi:hypothetical protein M9H77_23610 [Catharanthus roseus]|uniref:Uncharacterized protein n=1 Tax=Catharanthus roseus TaxID=4058 RepID=A0ACC0ATE1_CATRO|nr:hypothetical protein M9H77_23610 [Catharanthus roseus]
MRPLLSFGRSPSSITIADVESDLSDLVKKRDLQCLSLNEISNSSTSKRLQKHLVEARYVGNPMQEALLPRTSQKRLGLRHKKKVDVLFTSFYVISFTRRLMKIAQGSSFDRIDPSRTMPVVPYDLLIGGGREGVDGSGSRAGLRDRAPRKVGEAYGGWSSRSLRQPDLLGVCAGEKRKLQAITGSYDLASSTMVTKKAWTLSYLWIGYGILPLSGKRALGCRWDGFRLR